MVIKTKVKLTLLLDPKVDFIPKLLIIDCSSKICRFYSNSYKSTLFQHLQNSYLGYVDFNSREGFCRECYSKCSKCVELIRTNGIQTYYCQTCDGFPVLGLAQWFSKLKVPNSCVLRWSIVFYFILFELVVILGQSVEG